MRNDAGLQARSPRGGSGRGSFFPSSFRAISSYLRSVSANASSIASTVRSAGASVASTVSLAEDERQREQVQWAAFDVLEVTASDSRHVLLLTYINGFQIWDVEEASDVRELVSRRDGPVAFLRLQPFVQESGEGGLKAARPLLLVVTGDSSNSATSVPGGFPGGYGVGVGSPPGGGNGPLFPTVVRFYSLRSHAYVHVLRFRSTICAVRCSRRVVAVALHAQIYCFDPITLQNIFSVLTYPTPQPGAGSAYNGYGAMAVGPRWLAYAANQPLMATTGRVSPQHLTPSPGVSPSTSPANGSLVAHYAKESSKHIAAGIVTLGDMGYKTLSRYCSELLPESAVSPGPSSPSWKSVANGHTAWQGGQVPEPEHAGIVIVRDFVSKTIVTQFRAHSSPLSALAFDPSGTLLVTASVHGHNLNVFRLMPSCAGTPNSGNFDAGTTYVHLYKLYRGLTTAVIQDISFSKDSQWIAISSSRGTSHLFAISSYGGSVGPQTHGTYLVDGLIGSSFSPVPAFPWWSGSGPVRVAPQALAPPPPAMTLSVVSRIKNGIGGWRGTVTGAAAAAAGRASAPSGAVAAIFHDGGGQILESEVAVGSFKDQFWVLAPSGYLIRYLLRPDGGYNNSNMSSVTVGMGNSNNHSQSQELRLMVEALEKWDVCRRPSWVDREERVDGLAVSGTSCEDRLTSRSVVGTKLSAFGKEGVPTEEMQRWFMSNAEVQMHHARSLPVWAKAKIYFQVMSIVSRSEDAAIQESPDGEFEIESLVTKVVEVRRKDLVPVIERLQNLTKIQGQREMNTNSLPGVSALQMQLFGEDGLQHGRVGASVTGPQIRRTSSGSSYGSEGAAFGAGSGGLNGFHQAYQDSPELSTAGTPTSLNCSPSFLTPHQQNSSAMEEIGLLGPSLNPESSRRCFQHCYSLCIDSGGNADTVIDTLPGSGGWEGGICAADYEDVNAAKEVDFIHHMLSEDCRNCGVLASEVYSDRKGADGRLHEMGDVQKAGFKELGIGPSPVFDHNCQANELLRECEAPQGQDCWKSPNAKGKMSPVMQLQSLGHVNVNEDSGAFCLHTTKRKMNGLGEDFSSVKALEVAVVEDIENTGVLSKGEDNEGVEAGDDVWEGAMFPFCEED